MGFSFAKTNWPWLSASAFGKHTACDGAFILQIRCWKFPSKNRDEKLVVLLGSSIQWRAVSREMWPLKVTLCVALASLASNAEQTDKPYTFPEPLIEAYEPRGLRVSIPDEEGIELFAFHGNINKRLDMIDAGDLSKDVVAKTADRWVFEDKRAALHEGDTLHFWLFVIKNHLGYKLDNQTYTIRSKSDITVRYSRLSHLACCSNLDTFTIALVP